MFGYVTIFKPELKVKDYYKYRAYYCGLCRTLQENFGLKGQITLSYDMTFVVILLTSLYESETSQFSRRCMAHPGKKQNMLQNEMSHYGAEMNIVLSYYHFVDDWEDEKSPAGLAGSKLLKKSVEKIRAKYPEKCRKIQRYLKELQFFEKSGITDLDAVSGSFGKLMGELLAYRRDQWEDSLRRMGFFLGKFIYLMDAYDDVGKDIEKGNYNPLIPIREQSDFEDKCYKMLTMMMAECSSEFEKLPCLLDADIIRNILYAGVWSKYGKIQRELKKGKVQENDK